MTDHTIHGELPSGFAYANEQQSREFASSGSVHGASKVCLVATADAIVDTDLPERGLKLGVRLRPPRTVYDIRSNLGYLAALARHEDPIEAAEWYITQYNLGWQASTRVGRTGQESEAWGSGMTNYAWDDGYLDHAAGRPKWHLTYCSDHSDCGEA